MRKVPAHLLRGKAPRARMGHPAFVSRARTKCGSFDSRLNLLLRQERRNDSDASLWMTLSF